MYCKISNRILYTTKILCKTKLVPSPMCTFCRDHEESLEHLLIYCHYTKIFWLSVISWLNSYGIKVDNFDTVTILFGIPGNNPANFLLNHIIFLGKQVIYYRHIKNLKPSVSLLKAKIIRVHNSEKEQKRIDQKCQRCNLF